MFGSLSILSVGTAALLWLNPVAPHQAVALSVWVPAVGDHLVVDTTQNIGYLLRADDSAYIAFPVITGQRRRVYYIGRSYDAATPDARWVVKSRDIKGDRVTFGPTGRFLRLYKDGDESTAYGIHEHRSEERMFSEESRYQSMGCVIVQSKILDVIEATYMRNGERLDVVTEEGTRLAGRSVLQNAKAGGEGGI